MRLGKMPKFGDVILAQIQFVDTFEVKKEDLVIISITELNEFTTS